MEEIAQTSLWTSFLLVTGVWAITVISPGPNFIVTVHAALARSRREGVLVAAGITLGTTIWAAASLLGLGLLFQTAGWLYQIVKLLGAAYLVYMGVRMLWSARATQSVTTGFAIGSATGSVGAGFRAFRRGLLTDLANPKAAAFFTSLFAVAVPPAAPLWFDAAIIATVVITAGGWYALVACAVRIEPVARWYRRMQRKITGLAGALFIGFGLRLASDR